MKRRMILFIMVLATLVCLCTVLVACNSGIGNGTVEYTVTVKSVGGLPLEQVTVSVYADAAMSALKGSGQTNETGEVSLNLKAGSEYTICLSDVPDGYLAADTYAFDGTKAELVLTSQLVKDRQLTGAALGLGDIMYDFAVTTPEGSEVALSQLLREKKAVLLNFRHEGCIQCATQLTYMEQAYRTYQQDVAMLAFAPLGTADGQTSTANCYVNVSFPETVCPDTWADAFGGAEHPACVVIDRYGMITLAQSQPIADLQSITELLEAMTAEDYQQKLYQSIGGSEIAPENAENGFTQRQAATTADGKSYTYETVVYNKKDGYYHVGSENGPLLLADLLGNTQFSQESSLWQMAADGKVLLDGKDYRTELEEYCNYAANSSLPNLCTVNTELYQLLQVADKAVGADPADDQEWLKFCVYYTAADADAPQLEDPVAGLAPFSAYTAKLGTNIKGNRFYYNRFLMPRGLLAGFKPSQTGVYRITSRNDSANGVDGWIFDGNNNALLTYTQDERLFTDSGEVSMLYYMEEGKTYYINIAFKDPYETGYIYYDIEYVKKEYEYFRLCAPGPFVLTADADGTYQVLTGGIGATLGGDGFYRVDLGNGRQGSKLYADFSKIFSLLGAPIATVGDVQGMIDKGGFDFTKTKEDEYILEIMAQNENDSAKTDEALKALWGDDFQENYEKYQVADVYAGTYHGQGKDYTQHIKAYLSQRISDGHKDRKGCVMVDGKLAKLLQMLMDKYTVANVSKSWMKLCYYYGYLGPGRV